MRKPTLAYVKTYRDRHGKLRRYFNPDERFQECCYPGLPGSTEFMEVYQAALEGTELPIQLALPRRRRKRYALVAAYLDCSPSSTSPFKLAPETQRTRRDIFSKISARRMVIYRSTAQSVQARVAAHAGTYAAHREQKGRDTVRAAELPQHLALDVPVGDEGRPYP